MSDDKLKQDKSSDGQAIPTPPEAEAAKPFRQVTADGLSVVDHASQGFDPYDTASLYIDKLEKQQD